MKRIDRYTDSMWKRDPQLVSCPYPTYYGRDIRIMLSAHYENGEVLYYVAIVFSCLEWRSVAVFSIDHTEYTAIAAKYYQQKHGTFYDTGISDVTGKAQYIGIYQTDYVLPTLY